MTSCYVHPTRAHLKSNIELRAKLTSWSMASKRSISFKCFVLSVPLRQLKKKRQKARQQNIQVKVYTWMLKLLRNIPETKFGFFKVYFNILAVLHQELDKDKVPPVVPLSSCRVPDEINIWLLFAYLYLNTVLKRLCPKYKY